MRICLVLLSDTISATVQTCPDTYHDVFKPLVSLILCGYTPVLWVGFVRFFMSNEQEMCLHHRSHVFRAPRTFLALVVPQTQSVESSDAQVAKLYICEINHLFLSWSIIMQMPSKLWILFAAASSLKILFTHTLPRLYNLFTQIFIY